MCSNNSVYQFGAQFNSKYSPVFLGLSLTANFLKEDIKTLDYVLKNMVQLCSPAEGATLVAFYLTINVIMVLHRFQSKKERKEYIYIRVYKRDR